MSEHLIHELFDIIQALKDKPTILAVELTQKN